MSSTLFQLISQPYDCLILVNSKIEILDRISNEIQSLGIARLNISKELSNVLMTLSATDRSQSSQMWFKDTVASFTKSPILCSYPDLLFHPSLRIDPFELFRQAARLKQLIILWPGEYSSNNLSYAIPDHHHYRNWNLSNSLLMQPIVLIRQISFAQGV